MDGHWITSADAQAPLAFAASGGNALAISAALGNRFGLDPSQRADVLTQIELRDRAARRWGRSVDDLFLTRDGLEQASRPAVAAWRAARLRSAGVRSVADLGCGLGLESRAFAAAGLQVSAMELDPDIAAFAAANLRQFDARVIVGDVAAVPLPDCDAYFLDPARRDPNAPRSVDGISGQRVADPEDWSPPWSWVCALNKQRQVAKVAPGIAHALIPSNASATWMQCDGDLVEASVWFNELRGDARSTAVAIADDDVIGDITSNDGESLEVSDIGAYVYDVHGVVTRAGLVSQLAARINARRIDERLGFLTSEHAVVTPFATAYRVVDSMAFESKRVVAALRALDAGNVTIVKRAFAADTERLRNQWLKKLSGSVHVTVILTRIGDQPTAVIAQLTN